MSNNKEEFLDSSLELSMFGGSQQKFRKSIAAQYEFYLSGPINSPSEYSDWFDTIRHAMPSDVIKLYINSTGGDVDTAIQFMRVLSDTQATVVCSIEGSCMSAATMIFLCADVFEISPNTRFMIHNYSGGMIGKGGEIFDQAVFERSWSKHFLKYIYRGFLTKKEIKLLLEGKDIWFTSDEVLDRMRTLVTARNIQAEIDTNE